MRRAAQSALLIVDVQNDFCTRGALAVPGSEGVVHALNRHIKAAWRRLHVYASRDWHPPTTRHFEPFGGQWPIHCVQDSPGAEFHPDLRLPPDVIVVTKGDHPHAAGYSAFEGRTPDGRALLDDLQWRGITHLYVGGLATDYCVRASALDAMAAEIRVTLLADAIAGVDLQPGDSDRAVQEMRERGARIATML